MVKHKALMPETLEAINRILVLAAMKDGIDNGAKVRIDCTVTESNIHHPTDSALLWDGVRVLARLMGLAARLDQYLPLVQRVYRSDPAPGCCR